MRTLFIVYDNGSMDHTFPMGFGALGAVLKKAGHEIVVWNQDQHHWPDEYLTTYLDNNKFDIAVISVIGGYYQYRKAYNLSRALNRSKQRPIFLMGGYLMIISGIHFFRLTILLSLDGCVLIHSGIS